MADGGELLSKRLGVGSRLHDHQCPDPGGIGASDSTVHHGRHEDVDESARLGAGKLLLADADDLKCVVADMDGASEDVRIAREAARPVVVGDDCIRLRSGRAVVILREQASEGRLQAEDVKHRAGDILEVGLLHLLIGLVGHIRSELHRRWRSDPLDPLPRCASA